VDIDDGTGGRGPVRRLRRRLRGNGSGHLPHRHSFDREFAVACTAMNNAAGAAEEESGSHRFEGVGLHHQRHLPRVGEKAVVDGEIRVGEKDAGPRVRMVPATTRPAPEALAARINSCSRVSSPNESVKEGPKACSQSSAA